MNRLNIDYEQIVIYKTEIYKYIERYDKLRSIGR